MEISIIFRSGRYKTTILVIYIKMLNKPDGQMETMKFVNEIRDDGYTRFTWSPEYVTLYDVYLITREVTAVTYNRAQRKYHLPSINQTV